MPHEETRSYEFYELGRGEALGPVIESGYVGTFSQARLRAIVLANEHNRGSVAIYTAAYGRGGSIVVHGWSKP